MPNEETPRLVKLAVIIKKMHLLFIFVLLFVLSSSILTSAMIPGSHTERIPEGQEGEPRRHWPHLLGQPAEEVENKIKAERPDLHVIRVPEHSMVTMDMRMDRVRVFVGFDGRVARAPRVG